MTQTFLERRWGPILYTMIAAMLLYLGFTLWSGAAELWRSLGKVGLTGVITVLGLSLVNYALRFGRWHLYLKWMGFTVPPLRNARFFLASFAFTATPGKLGEAIRSVFLRPFGVPYRSSLAALFVERLLDLAAALLFAVLGVLAYSRYSLFVLVPVLGISLTLCVLNSRRLRAALRTRLPARATSLLDALDEATVLSRGSRLLPGLLFSVVGWGAEALGFSLILRFMGLELPLLTSVGIYGLAITVGALSFLPGGIGGTEAVMIVLLGVAGVSTADAGAATILFRFGTLWFAVILGLLMLPGLERGLTLTPQTGADRASRHLP